MPFDIEYSDVEREAVGHALRDDVVCALGDLARLADRLPEPVATPVYNSLVSLQWLQLRNATAWRVYLAKVKGCRGRRP